MLPEDDRDELFFQVVVNDAGDYALWHLDIEIPTSWRGAGMSGPLAQCLGFIRQVRSCPAPRSLRLTLASPSVPRD
jgi:MbtH protein